MSWQTETAADGPLAWLDYNGAVGNDVSGNNLDGTQGGTVTATSGTIDGAGTHGSVYWPDEPAAFNLTSEVCVEFVGKVHAFPASNGDIITIGGKGYDGSHEAYVLMMIKSGADVILRFGAYVQSTNTAYVADWIVTGWSVTDSVHIVGEYNSSTQRWNLYFNGTLVAQSAASALGPQSSTSQVVIGAEDTAGHGGGYTRSSDLLVDEFLIYDHHIGQTRVTAHFAQSGISGGALGAGTLTATAIRATSVTFTYQTVSGGTAPYSNQLQYRLAGSGTFLNIGSPVTGSSVTLQATGLADSTAYEFRTLTTDNASATATSGTDTQTTWTVLQATYVNRGLLMFVHVGPASIHAYTNEWADGTMSVSTWNAGIALTANPEQWCRIAKAMGAAGVVLIASHTDGFALWNSTAASAYKSSRDLVAEFVAACRGRGMAVGIYLNFWHRKLMEVDGGSESDRLTRIEAFENEILGGTYGTIDIRWIDSWDDAVYSGGWPSFTNVPYATVNNLIKSLQPSCAVVINRHQAALDYGDIWEREGGTVGDNIPADNLLPAEQSDTTTSVSGTQKWFYAAGYSVTSSATIAAEIATVQARNGAALINFPPDNTGVIPSDLATLAYTLGGSDVTAPSTPTGLSASAGNASVTLTWTASGAADLDGYIVYQSTDNSTFTPAAVGTLADGRVYAYTNPHAGTVVSGLSNGTTYYFKITAFDHSDNESAKTSAQSATPANTNHGRLVGFSALVSGSVLIGESALVSV